jgi:[methyl-Co(III) methanol-specific corrinoid protein]:coenzyme M methyltransferase
MYKLSEAAYTVMGLEGFRIPFDLCIEAEAFGCTLKAGDKDTTPSIVSHPMKFDMPSDMDSFFEKGRFPVIFQAITELSKKYNRRLPIYGGIVGPTTLSGHLFNTNNIMRLIIRDPEKVQSILLSVAEFSSYYANRLIEKGSNVILIIDPTASGNMISHRQFEKYVIPAYKILRRNINVPIILHICGDTNNILEIIAAETGFEAFSFEGPTVDVKYAKNIVGDRIALAGNIPIDLMLSGTPSEIKRKVYQAIEDGINIIMTSCGIPIYSPMENVKAMVDAVNEYNENEYSV